VECRRDADEREMHARYVPVTRDEIDAVAAAAGLATEPPMREALEAIVRAYETSSVSCIHASVFRAGSGGRCADCGAWV
jgi:hypothetical protein